MPAEVRGLICVCCGAGESCCRLAGVQGVPLPAGCRGWCCLLLKVSLSIYVVPGGPVVAALHARSVETPVPLLVTATVAKTLPCLWPLPWAAQGPHRCGGGLDPGFEDFCRQHSRLCGCLAASSG